DRLDPLGVLPPGRPAEAGSEQRVDDDPSCTEVGFGSDLDPYRLQRFRLERCGPLQSGAVGAGDAFEPSPAMEVTGGGKAIAAIVAVAADHNRYALAVPGDLPARGLHQPLHRHPEALGREPVDLPSLRASQRRQVAAAGR